ncbi:MAG TPA: TonB-dependent receptor [Longimicrobiaceae bacterium]|nr:TonB-dependent receptor [Longimicrobiaceae bacterium]
MRRTPRLNALLVLLSTFMVATDVRGQDSDLIRGRVLEAGTGTAVAGAVVEIEGRETRSALTGSDGWWRIAELPAGEYRLRIHHIGYSERSLEVRVPSQDEVMVTLTPKALPLDAVVVTASRRLQRLADVPVTTELITRSDIEQAGVSGLASLLAGRTGIQLEGGHPVGEGVMLQGLGSERVLILLDGQPLVGRISGQLSLSRIPTSVIERIEVIKGPQSSLYGSEAMGGVVNIITRDAAAEQWDLGIDLSAGTQGRADATSTLRGTVGSVGYLFSGGRRVTELTPGRAEETGALSETWDGLFKLEWSPDPSFSLATTMMMMNEDQRWRGGQLFHFADNVQRSARLEASWASGVHRLSPTIYVTEFDHLSRRATSPEPIAGSGEDEVQRLVEGELLYNLALGTHALDLGVEAKRESTHSDKIVGRERTHVTVEPFMQATVDLGKWNIVPGARVSWSDQWGTHITPRIATLYRPVSSLALRASVGMGYRAPAFKELYMTFLNVGPGFGYTVRGNPELQPETSTNYMLGAELAHGWGYLRGQLYYNQFDDFIETRVVGDSSGIDVHTYGNISEGYTRGIELEGGVTRGGFRAEAGYGYLEARDAAADRPLLGRPAHSGRLSLEYGLPIGLRSAVTGVYTGTAPVERTEAGLIERDGYFRLDLRVAQDLPRGLEISVGARNVLDAQPDNWPGFAGRHLYIGLGWQGANASDEFSQP